jgi:hypothetical protein
VAALTIVSAISSGRDIRARFFSEVSEFATAAAWSA